MPDTRYFHEQPASPETTPHHYLVLTWAEEPGSGTFTEDLDWQISHPPTCEPLLVTITEAFEALEYQCAIQYEIDNVGVDAFGWKDADRARCWSAVPAVFPIEHYHEVIRGFDWVEHDAGIRAVEAT